MHCKAAKSGEHQERCVCELWLEGGGGAGLWLTNGALAVTMRRSHVAVLSGHVCFSGLKVICLKCRVVRIEVLEIGICISSLRRAVQLWALECMEGWIGGIAFPVGMLCGLLRGQLPIFHWQYAEVAPGIGKPYKACRLAV